MRREKEEVLFLTDTRCTGSEVPFWRKLVQETLGQKATILMVPVSRMAGMQGSPRASGCAVILNDYWGGRQCGWFKDDSGLGLVLGVYHTLMDTRLLVMNTYWPVQATLQPGQLRSRSSCLMQRVEEHTEKVGSNERTAVAFIRDIILR